MFSKVNIATIHSIKYFVNPLKTVQDLCRHASERTTLRYYLSPNKEHGKSEHGMVFVGIDINKRTDIIKA